MLARGQHDRKDLSLALLYAVTLDFLLGSGQEGLRTVMTAVGEARLLGASAAEIRRALAKAEAESRGRQSPDAVARLLELLSG